MADRLKRLQLPVLLRNPRYPIRLASGSCVVCASADRQIVLKSPFAFNLDNCDVETRQEYETFAKESQELLEREKEIYQHLGPHNNLLPILEITKEGLLFPYVKNGNLRDYLACHQHSISQELRTVWVKEALQVIGFIHSKSVLQADLSTRNFLIADDLTILLCDFSGSALGNKGSLVSYETRYAKVSKGRTPDVSVVTELFAIGSLVYEITTGKKPYEELAEEEIEQCYDRGTFPPTDRLRLGHVITKCWEGKFRAVDEVLREINRYSQDLS